MATPISTTSRFHNLSDAMLADEIGRADSISKAAEAELRALKDEFNGLRLREVAGKTVIVTATEQIAARLDVKAIRAFLVAAAARFENPVISTVIRIRAANRILAVAA